MPTDPPPLNSETEAKPFEQDADKWVRELKEAGWSQWVNPRGGRRWDMWVHPNGAVYRGPFKAWQIMKSEVAK